MADKEQLSSSLPHAGPWERLSVDNDEYNELHKQPAKTAPAPQDGALAEGTIPGPMAIARPELPPTPGFGGTVVAEDTVVAGSLQVMSDRLVLWGGGVLLGSWSHDTCQIARLTTSRFAIQAEGETITFTADEPSELDQALAAIGAKGDPAALVEPVGQLAIEQPAVGPSPIGELVEPAPTPDPAATRPAPSIAATEETKISTTTPEPRKDPFGRRPRIKSFQAAPPEETEVAESEIAAVAAEPPGEEPADEEESIADQVLAIARRDSKSVKAHRFLAADIKAVAIKVGAVIAFVAFLGGIAYTLTILMGRLGPSAPPQTTLAQSVSTTTPAPITAPPATATTGAIIDTTTLFEASPVELTERWNQMTRDQFPELMLVNDLTSPFIVILTPNVTMEGVIDPQTGSVTMRATPTGTAEGDKAILTSLGLLIGIADQSLSVNDRAALLSQLGLDIAKPELAGIDGSLDYNGLTYRLVYKEAETVLEFVITPTGAVTTTVAN